MSGVRDIFLAWMQLSAIKEGKPFSNNVANMPKGDATTVQAGIESASSNNTTSQPDSKASADANQALERVQDLLAQLKKVVDPTDPANTKRAMTVIQQDPAFLLMIKMMAEG